jgi:hypothetical protein
VGVKKLPQSQLPALPLKLCLGHKENKMTHFAKLDSNNLVIFVTVGRQEDDGKEDELSARTGEVYKQTSYNTVGGIHLQGGTPLRKNFAGIGFTYDYQRDAFIPPKPHHSQLMALPTTGTKQTLLGSYKTSRSLKHNG